MKTWVLAICAVLWAAAAAPAAQGDEVRFVGNRVIQADETIAGDAVVVTGDLVVRGHITGSAVAYVGNITLDSSAVVDGDVIARRGRIHKAPGAKVFGNMVEGKLPGLEVGREEERPLKVRRSYDLETEFRSDDERSRDREFGKWRDEDENTDVKLAYDKVNGLYIGLGVNQFPVSDYGIRFRTFGSGGYALASHSWQGRGGFGVGILPRSQLEFSLDVYHLTQTEDAWYMSDKENSLAAFFLHEDFRDYYLKEGFGTTLSWQPLDLLEVSARYQAEQHSSQENAANWALFGGDKVFLPNIPATEGMLREFVFGFKLDSRDDAEEPFHGWRLETELELSSPALTSDFDYRRVMLDLRRYQPCSPYINFDNRVRLGNSDGLLPAQKRFTLGGPSSLPGFELKAFEGREFALWNAEIRLHDESESRHKFLGNLGLFFFSDVGLAGDRPLGKFSASEWKNDVGVGLSDQAGSFRLQVAKRTDTSEDAYTWMLRIQRPF